LICKTCKSGFYQGYENDVPDKDGCVKKCSDEIDHCSVCTADGEKCTKCSKGLIPSPDGIECIE